MIQTPELQAKLQLYRQKSRDNTITQEELREAIGLMRQERVGAASTSSASREKKATSRAKKNINSDSLLDELGSI